MVCAVCEHVEVVPQDCTPSRLSVPVASGTVVVLCPVNVPVKLVTLGLGDCPTTKIPQGKAPVPRSPPGDAGDKDVKVFETLEKLVAPLNVGEPLNVGLPVNVPLRFPPPLSPVVPALVTAPVKANVSLRLIWLARMSVAV